MDCSRSSGVKGEENAGAEYNNNNVKRARLNSTLAALLDDPILADVSRKPSLSDVDTLISLELGSAMRISVLKLYRTSFDVAVMNYVTVKDLKMVIKRRLMNLKVKRRPFFGFCTLESVNNPSPPLHPLPVPPPFSSPSSSSSAANENSKPLSKMQMRRRRRFVPQAKRD